MVISTTLTGGAITIPDEVEASTELTDLFKKSYRFSHVNMDSCRYYSELLLQQAEKENNDWFATAAKLMHTSYLINTHQLGEANDQIAQAIKEAQVLKEPFLLSIAFNIRGMYAHAINDTERLIDDFINSLQYAEDSKNLSRVGIMATNVGFVHLDNENYSQAKEYFSQAQSIADSLDDVRLQASVAGGLGQLYLEEEDYESAVSQYKYALILSGEYGDVYNEAYTHLILGRLYAKQGLLDKAKLSFKESIAIFEKMGNVERRIQAYLNLIETYNQSKEYKNAISLANEVLLLVDDYESSDFKMQYYEALSEANAGLGDFKTAFLNYKEHKIWTDTVYSADKAAKVLELDTRHKLEKKDLNIELLSKKQAESEALLQQRNLTNVVAFLIILFISLALYTMWRRNVSKTTYSVNLEKKVQKRTEDLEVINQRLLNSNQELERFAYITSHDLKEPLRNINGFTTLAELAMNDENLDQAKDNLKMVKNSSKQMYELINAVLDYSKLRTEVKLEYIDLNAVLNDVQNSMAHIINEQSAEVISNNLPTLVGNRFQYFQIFQNIIENGIKYNEQSAPKVTINCAEYDNLYELSISDNGIGIDPIYHQQIFTMFKRLHSKSEYFGTGLGLATVKKIIDNLGGKIELKSDLGKGCTFVLSIPKISNQLVVNHNE